MTENRRKPWVPDEAMEKGRLLEYQRGVLGSEVEVGFVVGIGKKWLLIHHLDGAARLNGYQAIREADITRARLSTHRFSERALVITGQRPNPPVGIALDRTRDLLRTATRHFRIVGINIEYENESIRYIGAATRLRKRRFALEGVSRAAKWKAPTKPNYRYREVSRIDFDDDYMHALLAVLDDRARQKAARRRG